MIDQHATLPAQPQPPPHKKPPTPPARCGLARCAYRQAGCWIGAAMLLSFAAGMYANFGLQRELFAAPGFMLQAAGQPVVVGVIVMLGIIAGLLTLSVATVLHRLYGQSRPRLTLFLVVLVGASLAINVLEGATLLAMRSLSEAFVAAGAGAESTFQPARQVLRGLRNGIHFPAKLLGGFGVLLMFVLLLRQRGLPPALAGFGLFAAGLQMLRSQFCARLPKPP